MDVSSNNSILLFNPRSANSKARVPDSILSVAAVLDGHSDWAIVDGNLENDPWTSIETYLSSGRFSVFACTVMPGIQPRQAIPYSKKIRTLFPQIKIIWGGYFPNAHTDVVLHSGYVDAVFKGPIDHNFLNWIDACVHGSTHQLANLTYIQGGEIVSTPQVKPEQATLFPKLPYEKLDRFYNINRYLKKTWLGERTLQFHSSFGCPYNCSFCAIPGIFHSQWIAMDGALLAQTLIDIQRRFTFDAVEFSDNNFFADEQRVIAFCSSIQNKGIHWWGEGRADTILGYADSTLELMYLSGCRMIFIGAESGSTDTLKEIGKGGKQQPSHIIELASKLKKVGIIPEFSFVMGFPTPNRHALHQQLKVEMTFIRQIKKINPLTEIILYIFSPVPGPANLLSEKYEQHGLVFPSALEDWLSPPWLDFDLRRNPETPWIKKPSIRKIRNFETVLNARYPTVTDLHLTGFARIVLFAFSFFRYLTRCYCFPYEIKVLLKLFHYRRPEKEGF